MGTLFGAQAGHQFLSLWADHVDQLVAYTSGVAGNDAAKLDAALARLRDFPGRTTSPTPRTRTCSACRASSHAIGETVAARPAGRRAHRRGGHGGPDRGSVGTAMRGRRSRGRRPSSHSRCRARPLSHHKHGLLAGGLPLTGTRAPFLVARGDAGPGQRPRAAAKLLAAGAGDHGRHHGRPARRGIGTDVDKKRIAAGLRADMGATAIAPVFNGFPISAFAQNVGMVALTGIKSRFVVAAGGGILAVLGLLPVLGRVMNAIPQPVLGGAGIVLFGSVAAAGIRTLSRVNFMNSNVLIVAASIGVGIIPITVPLQPHSRVAGDDLRVRDQCDGDLRRAAEPRVQPLLEDRRAGGGRALTAGAAGRNGRWLSVRRTYRKQLSVHRGRPRTMPA